MFPNCFSFRNTILANVNRELYNMYHIHNNNNIICQYSLNFKIKYNVVNFFRYYNFLKVVAHQQILDIERQTGSQGVPGIMQLHNNSKSNFQIGPVLLSLLQSANSKTALKIIMRVRMPDVRFFFCVVKTKEYITLLFFGCNIPKSI